MEYKDLAKDVTTVVRRSRNHTSRVVFVARMAAVLFNTANT